MNNETQAAARQLESRTQQMHNTEEQIGELRSALRRERSRR